MFEMTIVYDNNPYLEGLSTAWGFSCLIRRAGKSLLFDTGGDGRILLANMRRLDIDAGDIDGVFLSHIHGDHVGGLEELLHQNPDVTICLPASFPGRFKNRLKAAGIEVIEVRNFAKIDESLYSTGELGTWIQEQSLLIQTENGLVVITGCAHPGIVKIVALAKEMTGEEILCVLGGFHLGGMSAAEIEKIIARFRELNVQYVGPCHCSGDLARSMFKEAYGERYIDVGVGRVIHWQGR